MFDDLSYESIALVIQSWEQARTNKRFEEKLGEGTLLRLFELAPETKQIFGFSSKSFSSKGINRMGILIHSDRILDMISTTLEVLGPDTDMVAMFLADLASRHARHGVRPTHFYMLTKALQENLADLLGDSWTKEVSEAWRVVLLKSSEELPVQ